MCGRYVSITKVKTLEKRFNVQAPTPELFTPNTNVSHGNTAPVITNEKPGELQFFQFGFTPSWAKKQVYMVNARSEGDHNKANDPQYSGAMGIVNKPMFRSSIRKRRCLVPADAFIEGPEKERLSKPYLMYRSDGERPFAFAGIWDEWVQPDTGEIVSSFAIITAPSNAATAAIGHHRSPVILDRDDERFWIDSGLPLAEVTSMLKPFDGRKLNAYPIATDIKNPRTNGVSLLEPIGQRIVPEYTYELYTEIERFGMGESRARKRSKDEGDSGRQGILF